MSGLKCRLLPVTCICPLEQRDAFSSSGTNKYGRGGNEPAHWKSFQGLASPPETSCAASLAGHRDADRVEAKTVKKSRQYEDCSSAGLGASLDRFGKRYVRSALALTYALTLNDVEGWLEAARVWAIRLTAGERVALATAALGALPVEIAAEVREKWPEIVTRSNPDRGSILIGRVVLTGGDSVPFVGTPEELSLVSQMNSGGSVSVIALSASACVAVFDRRCQIVGVSLPEDFDLWEETIAK